MLSKSRNLRRGRPPPVSGRRVDGPDENALAVARYQGRLARYAAVVAAAREEGAF